MDKFGIGGEDGRPLNAVIFRRGQSVRLSVGSIRCLLLVGALAAAGCATLDKDECINADWRTIGYQDGVRGKIADVIGSYREDCAEYGVTPDLDAYTAGRKQGLQEYCREANGFRVGYSGKVYQGVCPRELEYAFKVGYRDGRVLYELNAEIRSAERSISTKQNSLQELNEELSRAEAELISDGVTSDRRAQLLQRTRDLAKDIGALESEISALESDVTRKRTKLEALRKSSPYL